MDFDDYNDSDKVEEWELEYQDIVENLFSKLSGKVMDNKGKEARLTEPLMKKYGIGRFMVYFQSFLHKGIALSNFDESVIDQFTHRTSRAFDNEMIDNYKVWGVKPSTMPMISQIFSINLYSVLSRAKKGREQHWRAKKMKIRVSNKNDSQRRSEDEL